MFCGQFEIQIQNDGVLIPKHSDEHFLTAMFLERKGKTCTVYFDRSHLEIIFSFDNSLYDDEDFLVLSSFVTGGDPQKVKEQFCVPGEYLKYYPKESAFVIGLKDAICISKKEVDLLNDAGEIIDLLQL